ncbi:protein phosphatase 1D, partial [Trichonephila clavata]
NWPKTASGLPSTAGTTASVAFIRKGKLYTGHVGDSRIVIGLKEQGLDEWQAESLTIDHKPECPREKQRILESGGLVMNKSGVERVVWKRPRPGHEGPILRSTDFEKIPFLAVARSLGDLWSYDYFQQEFAVSPEPDLGVMSLDLNKDKCLILASDGLWNIMSPQSAVHLVQDVESENRKLVSKFGISENIHLTLCNPSRVLVDCGLERWNQLRTRADNVSVITVMLDPSEVGVLKEQLVLKMNYPRSLSVWDVGLRCKNFGDLLEAHGVENKMGYLRLVPRSASLTKAESLPNCFIGESNCDSDEGESSCSPLQPCSNFLPQHSSASKILRKMEAEGIENSPCRFPRWSKNATGRTSLSKLATWSKVVSHRRMSDPFPRMEVHPVNTEALSDSEGILEKNVDGLQERSIEPDLCDNDKDLKMGWNQLSGIKQAIKRKYPGTDVSQSFIGVENSQKRKVASSLLIMSNVIQS